MPIEKRPANPLPRDYVPQGGKPYRVKTKDDLGSVARAHGLTEDQIVTFNFGTRDPSEINWYLQRNVGCVRSTHDGKNWMFTSEANPGIIYLPPKWHRPTFPAKPAAASRKRSGIWFGLGVQEGGTLGIAGKDTVEACLYSLESYQDRFWMNIDGWRLGLGLGASIGAALVVATGVDAPSELQGFIAGGDVDFQLSLAGKWGDVAKAAKGLNLVRKVATAGKLVDKTLSLVEWEKTRDLIWNLYKATDIDSKKKAVNVLSIPGAGVGLEVSIYKSFGEVRVHDVTSSG